MNGTKQTRRWRAYFHGSRPGEISTMPGPNTQHEVFVASSRTAAEKVARGIAKERGWRLLDVRDALSDPNPAVRARQEEGEA